MQLGFLVFEVQQVDVWHAFLTEVLGLVGVGEGRYRNDGHAWRIQLVEGPADDLAAVGWELDEAELDAAVARLEAAGFPVTELSAGARGVRRRVGFTDPGGNPTELVTGMALASEPFQSPVVRAGFVADALGMGHLVLSAADKAASVACYTELLGVRLSDHIVTSFHGHTVDISFFHANARHHSVAFGGAQKKRLHHFLLEVRSLDEVGLAFDRFLRGGHRIFQTIGRHPNDRMVSFYAFTPSGFQVEVGWGGREVDDTTWEPTTYDHISEWGHIPIALLAGPRR